MSNIFRPKQGEISCQLEFAAPSFSLFSDVLQLGRVLWKHLSPHGLRLSDMKFEGGNTTYNEAHVQCFLFNYAAELNVRPERIDVRSFDLGRRDQTFRALSAATAATRECADDLALRSCTVVVAVHGEIDGTATRDFIDEFVRPAPAGARKQMSAGVAYYFHPEEARLSSSLTFDPSLSVTGGLFIRTTTIWNIEEIGIDTLAEVDADYTQRLLAAFEVTVAV